MLPRVLQSLLATAATWTVACVALGACQQSTQNPPPLETAGNRPPLSGGTNPAGGDSGVPVTDGGGVEVLASGLSSPTSIALDSVNVYWTDSAGGVGSVPRGGGAVTSIASAQAGPLSIVTDANVYWANVGNGAAGGGSIAAFNPASRSAATVVSGLVQPYGIAVDSQHLYWTADSVAGTGVDVDQAPLGGGPAVALGSVPGDLSAGGVAVSASNAYFLVSLNGGGGSLYSVPLQGGGIPETVWESTSGKPTALAMGSGVLYWVVTSPPPTGAVWAAPTSGGAPVALGTGLNSPADLAVDSVNVYWTSPTDGAVYAVPVLGGSPVVLASGLSSPFALAVDDAIYCTTANSIIKLPK